MKIFSYCIYDRLSAKDITVDIKAETLNEAEEIFEWMFAPNTYYFGSMTSIDI